MPWSRAERDRRRHRNGKPDQRAEGARDRDRILYSSAFHRLAGITQIVRAGEADVFHTRQQHTIKVAQIGRRLAQALRRRQPRDAKREGLDPEVVEAACLAHDLGHPPFGHIGEHTLDDLVRPSDPDGFEGNAQSFRILTKLAVRFDGIEGMDLTRATLAACLKYPWFREPSGKKSKKWSAYRAEAEDFAFARLSMPGDDKTAEAELMDWSDDIAYSVHDLEDFHRCNAIPWRRILEDPTILITKAMEDWKGAPGDAEDRLKDAFARLKRHIWGSFSYLLTESYDGGRDQREQLRRMTSQMIGKYIGSIRLATDSEAPKRVVFVEEDVDEVRILKQITRDYVINSPALHAQQHGQKRILTDLYNELFAASSGGSGVPKFLPVRLQYLRPLAGTSTARFVADCIASLSEREAIGLHGRLFGTATGSVLDPIVR
jgi:dGTPase